MRASYKKAIITLGVFLMSAFVTYGAGSASGQYLKSSPYLSIDASSDAELTKLTGGSGAIILDGIVAKVKAKATTKAGNPFNASTYNEYIDNYLDLVSDLDDATKTTYGSDYSIIFKYIYPRVYALKVENKSATLISELQGFLDKVDGTVATGATSATQNNTIQSVNTASDAASCTFNLNPYLANGATLANGSATTSFYVDKVTGKSYTPTTTGEMTLPGNMRDNFYVTKNSSPLYYFQCQNGELTVMDMNASIIKPLEGTTISASGGLNDVTVSSLVVICAENGWPASIEIKASSDVFDVGVSNGAARFSSLYMNPSNEKIYRAQLASDAQRVVVAKRNTGYTSVYAEAQVSNCEHRNYAARPEVTSAVFYQGDNKLVLKTKNMIVGNDFIDITTAPETFMGMSAGCDAAWTCVVNDLNTWAGGKTAIAYMIAGNSTAWIYGSFVPNYWRNGAGRINRATITVNPGYYDASSAKTRPTITINRSNQADGQHLAWSTTNTKSVSFACSGPGGDKSGTVDTAHTESVTTWDSLHSSGWTAGVYSCTWKLTGENGESVTQAETFSIQ